MLAIAINVFPQSISQTGFLFEAQNLWAMKLLFVAECLDSIPWFKKENGTHMYKGILLSQKRNEIVSFAEMWKDLETIIQSEVSQKEKKQVSYINSYMWNLEKWYGWTYLQSRNRERCREQMYGHQEGERGGWNGRFGSTYVHFYV